MLPSIVHYSTISAILEHIVTSQYCEVDFSFKSKLHVHSAYLQGQENSSNSAVLRPVIFKQTYHGAAIIRVHCKRIFIKRTLQLVK